jgi:hypothetical protein
MKENKYAMQDTCVEPSPKLAQGLQSWIVPMVLPKGHLLVMLLLQQGIDLRHLLLLVLLPLLLLLLPIRRRLHVSVQCVLHFTLPNLQSSKACVGV